MNSICYNLQWTLKFYIFKCHVLFSAIGTKILQFIYLRLFPFTVDTAFLCVSLAHAYQTKNWVLNGRLCVMTCAMTMCNDILQWLAIKKFQLSHICTLWQHRTPRHCKPVQEYWINQGPPTPLNNTGELTLTMRKHCSRKQVITTTITRERINMPGKLPKITQRNFHKTNWSLIVLNAGLAWMLLETARCAAKQILTHHKTSLSMEEWNVGTQKNDRPQWQHLQTMPFPTPHCYQKTKRPNSSAHGRSLQTAVSPQHWHKNWHNKNGNGRLDR